MVLAAVGWFRFHKPLLRFFVSGVYARNQTLSAQLWHPVSKAAFHSQATLEALRDEDLFSRFMTGEDGAYVVLYRRYGARVLNYIQSLLGREDRAADDLYQETFLRLFRERSRHHSLPPAPIKNVGGWLFRVARNLTLNHIRSARYLTDFPSNNDEILFTTVEEAHAELFGDGWDEESLLHAVKTVVETLPAGLREVFILREVNGMSYEETAEIVGCSEEAARMRMSRARSAIRRALQSFFVENER
jgi:RNA polymerase sigma-70 factor (ECF subfamily)